MQPFRRFATDHRPIVVDMREFSICMDVRLEPSSYHEDLALDLIRALEEDARALGPVTSGDAEARVVSARFNVQAPDAVQALEEARAVLADALRALGIKQPLDIVAVELEEYVEEEA